MFFCATKETLIATIAANLTTFSCRHLPLRLASRSRNVSREARPETLLTACSFPQRRSSSSARPRSFSVSGSSSFLLIGNQGSRESRGHDTRSGGETGVRGACKGTPLGIPGDAGHGRGTSCGGLGTVGPERTGTLLQSSLSAMVSHVLRRTPH